jgi:hypothetical protein
MRENVCGEKNKNKRATMTLLIVVCLGHLFRLMLEQQTRAPR